MVLCEIVVTSMEVSELVHTWKMFNELQKDDNRLNKKSSSSSSYSGSSSYSSYSSSNNNYSVRIVYIKLKVLLVVLVSSISTNDSYCPVFSS